MARLPRLVIAGQLHLVMQRSHGANPVFQNDQDFASYRRSLAEAAAQHGVAIHAYVLMPAQVLLLATPDTDPALSRLSQTLGRRFGADYNRRHGRSGALWEGRFRTTIIEPTAHLIDALRYVECAPLRAGLTDSAGQYAWSSAAHHVGLRGDAMLTEHALYWKLGNTPFEREARYRKLLEQPLASDVERRIGEAAVKGWVVGDAGFVRQLGGRTDRRLVPLARGRPSRKTVPK